MVGAFFVIYRIDGLELPLELLQLLGVSHNPQDITLLKFISKNLNWSTLDSAKSEKDEDIEVVNFHEFIAEGLEKDGITLRDPELLIYTILELVNSTCYNVILEKEPVSFEEYKPYLYDIIRSVVNNSVISE